MKIKLAYFSLMLFTALGSAFSQEEAPLKFDNSNQKFGKVDEGKDVYLTYHFTNESNKPIVINEAKVNCSCTVVTFPKEPIRPKTKSEINVGFHTKGKIGYQERTVVLITDQGQSEISFKGTVRASKDTKQDYKDSH